MGCENYSEIRLLSLFTLCQDSSFHGRLNILKDNYININFYNLIFGSFSDNVNIHNFLFYIQRFGLIFSIFLFTGLKNRLFFVKEGESSLNTFHNLFILYVILSIFFFKDNYIQFISLALGLCYNNKLYFSNANNLYNNRNTQ